MKAFYRWAVMAVCACLLALPATAAPYKSEYKLSVVPGATSGWGMTGTFFADLVRERSQGRINIKVYHSSQLLAGKQTSEFCCCATVPSILPWPPPSTGPPRSRN